VLGTNLVTPALQTKTGSPISKRDIRPNSRSGIHTLLEKCLDIQHRCNPLHVYCRLLDNGLNKRVSISICKYYEIFIYSWLVSLTAFGVHMCRLVRPAR